MNRQFPVYTIENECQDCYKCIRHCHCKAIKIVNARAAVIPELCVSCGECVRICPAHAKKIRSDIARLENMLQNGDKVYASVAPSFVGYFKGISIFQLAAALKNWGSPALAKPHTAHRWSAPRPASLLPRPATEYISPAHVRPASTISVNICRNGSIILCRSIRRLWLTAKCCARSSATI